MKQETFTELLKLREKLTAINNVGFSFSQLNKRYPIDTLTETQAGALIETYFKYLEKIKKLYDEK